MVKCLKIAQLVVYMSKNKTIVIIGGGFAGLAAGYELAKQGKKVTILEKDPVLGGLAQSFEKNNCFIPIVYHHVLNPDTTTREYIKELGLDNLLTWHESPQSFYYLAKTYLLSKPQHIFKFSPLSWPSRLRVALLGVYCLLRKNWNSLEHTGAEEWLNKFLGKEATDLLFKNLIVIKFNMPLDMVSMAWLGRRLHQSVRNFDRYGYLNGGIQVLVDKLAKKITDSGGEIYTNCRVTGLDAEKASALTPEGEKVFPIDKVISTIPPHELKKIYHTKILDLPVVNYKSVISLVLSSKTKLTDCYWSVILKPHLLFGGIFNHTLISPSDSRNGEDIYYLFTYLDEDNELMQKTEEELFARYRRDLERIYPEIDYSWYRIFKIPNAAPVYYHDYRNPGIKLDEKVYLAGVYRTYPSPRTMNAALESGRETAQAILNEN